VDDLIREMISTDRTVIADIVVDPTENCFPMIPSGSAHNEMILGSSGAISGEQKVSENGMVLV